MNPDPERIVSKFRSFISHVTTAKNDPSQATDSDNYLHWRSHFIWERPTLLYILGLIANPVFILADVLLYPQHLDTLFNIRIILRTWISHLLSFCEDQAGSNSTERVCRPLGARGQFVHRPDDHFAGRLCGSVL
jgi:hypothetical protein